MDVKSFVNGYEVVASGLVHVVGSKLTIVFDGMPVEISFIQDGAGVRYSTAVVGNSVVMSLFNFATIGDGRIEPVAIASSNGRDVQMTFWVNTINSEQMLREFRYTFLLGPKIND